MVGSLDGRGLLSRAMAPLVALFALRGPDWRELASRALNSAFMLFLAWAGFFTLVGIIAAVLFGDHKAYAATLQTPGDGAVIIPWGDWFAGMLEPVGAFVVAAILWAMRRLPSSIYLTLQMMRAEQLVQRAVDYALSATAGAVAGKQLDVFVASDVLESAAEYAVEHAPGLVKTIGGTALFKQKVLARLNVAEDVSALELRLKGAL